MTNFSPARGGSPSFKNVLPHSGKFSYRRGALTHNPAVRGATGNPFAAYSIAGSNSFAKGSLPNFFESSIQPETAPGTVTGSQPVRGISFMPAKRDGASVLGARPEALRP